MAESLCYTSYKKFVNKYGLIENVTAYKDENGKLVERGYWTNSTHTPVWKDIDPFKKIDIESELAKYSSAGCITYVEVENAKLNEKAIEDIIVYAMTKKDIPYLAINITEDQCLNCGFSDEDYVFVNDTCPVCGSTNIQKPRRVTGYLGYDVRVTFNEGKQMEEKDRKKHASFKKKNLVEKYYGNPVVMEIKKHD